MLDVSRASSPKQWITVIVLAIASPFLIYRGGLELLYFPEETAPTAVAMDQFVARDANLRWLSIKGRLLVRIAWSPPQGGRSFVPMVPPDWRPGDPIRLVFCFDNASGNPARRLPATAGEPDSVVTGFAAPTGAWNIPKMFPGASLAEPVVVIYAGQTPTGPFFGWFQLVLGLVLGLVSLLAFMQHVYRGHPRRGSSGTFVPRGHGM